MFVSQAGLVEAYVVGGATALAGLYALWRLEQVDLQTPISNP
jgi:hypothetical protein